MTDFVDDIFNQKEKLSKEFYDKHQERIKGIKSKINTNIFHLISLSTEGPSVLKVKHSLDTLQLIDRATKLNISCVCLVEKINFIESAILSRSIIELCSTSIAISKDESKYIDFITNEKFEATKTISTSKKFIPEIGKLWGDLSNYIVHINSKMYGTKRHLDSLGEHVMTEFRLTTLETIIPEDLIEAMFDHIELITYLILYTIEVIFFHKITYKGIDCFAYPNKKKILLGVNGHNSFSKLYKKMYNITI